LERRGCTESQLWIATEGSPQVWFGISAHPVKKFLEVGVNNCLKLAGRTFLAVNILTSRKTS
jgi:hypothetical protein